MSSRESITRRAFVVQSTSLLSASLLSMQGLSRAVPKYKMGIQLFSVRAPLAQDLTGTIKKLASVGYEDCETYGYDPEKGTFYGLKSRDFKQLLSDHKMTATSGHFDFAKYFDKPQEELLRYADSCVEGAHALGLKYVTWPWLDPNSRTIDKFKLLTGKLNAIGERVNKAGLGFAYHNHDFEFIDQNGEIGYDIVLRDTDPALVKLQMDLYWVMHSSKRSPGEIFRLQPGRFVMWHIKDMDKMSRDYSELGNGSIDFTQILPDATMAGLQYYYIEQGGNFAKDPVTSVSDSAVYFKKNLEKYLQ